MSRMQFREPEKVWPDLQSKPQRRSSRHLLFLSLILGTLIVLGAGTWLAFQLVFNQAAPRKAALQKAGGTIATHAVSPLPQPSVVTITCADYPSGYDDALRQELAQGLHLTVPEVAAQLQAGKSLQEIAAAQHISPDQLSGIERYAYKVSDVQMVKGGCMSQAEASKHPHESAAALNQDFTHLFSLIH